MFQSLAFFKALDKAVTGIDAFTAMIGKTISWLTLLVVVLTFTIVVLRYGFNIGSTALQESVLYFHGIVFMLGAAFTLQHNEHVRVDIFYHHKSPVAKAWINLLGALFLLIPVCVFIFVISFDYVIASWSIMEKSSEAGGLPWVYLSKSFLFLFTFFLLLQGLAELGRNVLVIKGIRSALFYSLQPKTNNETLSETKPLSASSKDSQVTSHSGGM